MIEKNAEAIKIAGEQGRKLAGKMLVEVCEFNEQQNALMGKIASLSDEEIDELKPYAEIGEKVAAYYGAGEESGFIQGAQAATVELMKIAQEILPQEQYGQFAGAVAPQEEAVDEDVQEVVNAATEEAAKEIVETIEQENPEALNDPQVQQEVVEMAQTVGETVGQQYLEQKAQVAPPQE